MAVDNQSTITAFLRGKGLTTAQIAGVEGNLKIESGFSPTAYNPGERAIGIAQWEGPRRTALQSYARNAGSTETNLATQLGFLWHELTTSERGALTALKATTTPRAAAAVFDQRYERSSGEARSARESAATVIARTLGGAGGIDSSVGGLAPSGSSKGKSGGSSGSSGADDGGGGSSSSGGGSSSSGGAGGGAGAQAVGFLSKVSGVDYLLGGARNLLLEGTFVVLAAALVGGGVYKLFGPQIKAAAKVGAMAAGPAGKAAAAAA